MRLALTVRYGYDEELIFAQQLGADAVIMRLPVEAVVASAELPSTAAVDPAESVAMQATSTAAAAPTDSTLLAAAAYRAAACGLPLAGVELSGMPQDAGAWMDALRMLLDSAAATEVRRLFCAPPGCASGAPEPGAPDHAVAVGAPVRSTAPSRSRDRTAGPDPVPVMNTHPAAMLASVAPVALVAAGAGVDIVVPVDRAALGRAEGRFPDCGWSGWSGRSPVARRPALRTRSPNRSAPAR